MVSRLPKHWYVDVAPLVLAAALVALIGSTWAARAFYPYDLEWMEGGMLVHAWRLEHGLPLYVEPGPAFIPYIYPPGYASVVAVLGSVVGLGHATGRAVSMLGTLIAAVCAVEVVRKHGRSLFFGLLTGAIFLGCYTYSGDFYDLVRNDGLFVGLLAWSITLALDGRKGTLEASGLMLAAAYIVKQNAALFGIPIALGLWSRDGWRAAARYAAWSAGPALAITGWIEWRSGGRFLTYLVRVPATHPMVRDRLLPGTPWELGEALPFALPAAVVFFASRAAALSPVSRSASYAIAGAFAGILGFLGVERPPKGDLLAPIGQILKAVHLGVDRVAGIRPPGFFASLSADASLGGAIGALALAVVGFSTGRRWPPSFVFGASLGVVALIAGMLMRGHEGGYLNVYMHLHWVVAVAFGLAAARWCEDERLPTRAIVAALFCLQLGWQLFDVSTADLVPDAADREANDAMVDALRDAEDPILSPIAPWLPVQAGHDPSGFALIALWDVEKHEKTPFPEIGGRLQQAMKKHYWKTVVDGVQSFGYGVNKFYQPSRRLPGGKGDAMPKTGWRNRPGTILVPREAAMNASP